MNDNRTATSAPDPLPAFGGLEGDYTDLATARIAILPIPYDAGSSWRSGADRGPQALLEASGNMELYDIETHSLVFEQGIHTAPPLVHGGDPESLFPAARLRAKELLDQGKFLVTLGGNHSITPGVFKAHVDAHGPLTLVQIDAHADMRESYEGDPWNHACVMARMAPWAEATVQIGIRSMDSSEQANIAKSTTFWADAIHRDPAWVAKVIAACGPKVYLTVDLDGFDPSIMPSTGTPEPGGLSYGQAIDLVRALSRERELVGFDITELLPEPTNPAPDFLAAKFLYQILSFRFQNGKPPPVRPPAAPTGDGALIPASDPGSKGGNGVHQDD